MGVVLTVNKINAKPKSFSSVVTGKEEIMLDGSVAVAETKIYHPELVSKPEIEKIEAEEEAQAQTEEMKEDVDDEFVIMHPNDESDEEEEEPVEVPGGDIVNYEKFKLKHSQKFSVNGTVGTKEFSEILKIYSFDVYMNDAFAISYGKDKGRYAQAAFKRLNKATEFKSFPLQINLIEALEKIIKSSSGITVQSGWFSNLDLPNLDSVFFRGEDANRGADWNKYKAIAGASLSNIELLIDDPAGKDGLIPMSLSKGGILFCKRNISPDKALEITERVFKIIFGK